MSAKTSDDHGNLLSWLYKRGEETVGQVLQDLVGRPGMSDGLSKMVHQAARTKGRMDKNAETILHLLNLPSRTDYDRLLLKIQHLQGSLVNLNMKVDRLLAAQERREKKKSKVES